MFEFILVTYSIVKVPEERLDSSGIENTPRKRWVRLVEHTKKLRDLPRKEVPEPNHAVQTASSPQQKELEAEHWLELIDG